MGRAPWGHVSRHCVYCREVGPRVVVYGGFAHRRCIPKESKRRQKRSERICPDPLKGLKCEVCGQRYVCGFSARPRISATKNVRHKGNEHG